MARSPLTHIKTHTNLVEFTLLAFGIHLQHMQHNPIFLCLPQFFVSLKSSPYLILSFPVFTSCSFFGCYPPPLSFRVTWLRARANPVRMNTTPWCCTTTTAPAGLSRSSCPSLSICFGGRMSVLSSGTAPVSRNWVVAWPNLPGKDCFFEHIFFQAFTSFQIFAFTNLRCYSLFS